ncbi:MAG: HAMP domain-containing sensor histidine kinase [Rhodocyclaceae bacterium]|nr:HAMP domain-containing sensor histidine kinase [Rhodocyclaceae bacterium]
MRSGSPGALRHSLRLRLAATFALFGMLVSLLLSAGVFVAAQHTSDRLIDETLRAELDDYLSRRARNPASLPPATISIRGYVYAPGDDHADIPRPVLDLPVGKHQLLVAGIPYRISAVESDGMRYVMMFNEARQRQREEQFFIFLAGGILVMALVSAGLGWWLAGRVVAPVAELARLIGTNQLEQSGGAAVEFANDEIGKLASGVFGEYVKRMRAFISREQAFTTDVSHELRTPLSIVRGVVELMEDDQRLDELERGRIDRIRRAVDGMIDITSALLVMAREDSLREAPSTPCDVCEVVRDAIDAHRHLVGANATVQFDCRSHPRLLVEGTLLKIVVANLVLNAFTHTDAGTVAIVVDENGIAVNDTGRGILGEELGKVFQKHFKGADSTGAGIGLSLVKRICDRYGWEIAIDSTVGRGTSARLIFAASQAGS